MSKTANIYEEVTRNLLQKMEQGVIPWRRPWGNRSSAIPTNLFSRRQYRGVNVLRLMAEGRSAWWATAHQVAALGGKLQAGAKPVKVISMFMFEDTDGSDNFRSTVSEVYNLDDCDELCAPHSMVRQKMSPIESCEKFLAKLPKTMPKVSHGGKRAVYYWNEDMIKMPVKESFDNMEQYYATLFHEYGHSTGHEDRLDREYMQLCGRGLEVRAFEELVAELTSAFVCAQVGIAQVTDDRAAHYLKHWLKHLRSDPRELIRAAAHAQKAADYMQGIIKKVAKKKNDKNVVKLLKAAG